MSVTTIQLDTKTRKKLAGLKARPRESYDEVLNKLMRLIPEGDEEGTYTAEFRAGLLEARLDSIAGRLIDDEDLDKFLR